MGLRDFVEKRKAEQARPKTLAELRKLKQAQTKPSNNGLAALRAKKQAQQAQKKSKLDFHRGGIRFHNVRPVDSYWMIDVTNGDMTYTFHNRHGAWMHDVDGREGWMAEPARVARALGTNMSQLEMAQNLMHRLEIELHERGILTRSQQLRQHEEAVKAERRKQRHQADD